MSATVVALPTAVEPWISKNATDYGRSVKWVEKLMRQGMPYRKDTPTSWPMFRLSEVDEWLRNRHAPKGTDALHTYDAGVTVALTRTSAADSAPQPGG